MIIKKFAFGDNSESFIESRLTNRVNLIFSNENNRGKTLVLQGLMYSIGNEPIFPSGFNYQNYYFFSEIEFNGRPIEFLRRKNTIVIKDGETFQVCNTISEYKHFLKEYIEEIPEILKSDQLRLVDPSLFYELFFIGQDKRDTSNVISKGYYNKKDFVNMLFSMSGIKKPSLSAAEIRNIKEDIKRKGNKVKSLRKSLRELRVSPDVSELVLNSSDNTEFQSKKKRLKEVRDRISSLKRSRTREENRKYKLESLLTELNSLNRKVEIGKVVCADCGSENILYKGNDLDFDISNKIVRDSIVDSIKRTIDLKSEIVDELNRNVEKEQDLLRVELEEFPPEMRDILLYKEELRDASGIDQDIVRITREIDELKSELDDNSSDTAEERLRQTDLVGDLLKRMNSYYEKIDSSGTLSFIGLFTKKGETYSGSSGQEFYFCKIMAIRDYFNHEFPIVIDSFRDGEVSTKREVLMLELFEKISNQVILTSTLKDEEYSADKYVSSDNINVIDYSGNKDSKILSSKDNDEFMRIIESFNVNFS